MKTERDILNKSSALAIFEARCLFEEYKTHIDLNVVEREKERLNMIQYLNDYDLFSYLNESQKEVMYTPITNKSKINIYSRFLEGEGVVTAMWVLGLKPTLQIYNKNKSKYVEYFKAPYDVDKLLDELNIKMKRESTIRKLYETFLVYQYRGVLFRKNQKDKNVKDKFIKKFGEAYLNEHKISFTDTGELITYKNEPFNKGGLLNKAVLGKKNTYEHNVDAHIAMFEYILEIERLDKPILKKNVFKSLFKTTR